MYLAEWRVSLPVGEVHALLAGRKHFQPARMCLAGYPRIPARGCGFPLKKQPDIWRLVLRYVSPCSKKGSVDQ
jgi:hypothetical protein